MLAHTRFNNLHIKSIVGMGLAILLAALFSAPNAVAGCKNGKGKCNNPPNPAIVSSGYSLAGFTGTYAWSEGDAVACNTFEGNTAASGDYNCGLDQLIFFKTTSLTYSGSRRDEANCKTLDYHDGVEGARDVVGLTPAELTYGWTDDCTDGMCRIEVRGSFDDPVEVMDATLGAADSLEVVFSGWLTRNPDLDEANPFRTPGAAPDEANWEVLVPIDRIDVLMLKSGSRKPAGECVFGVYNQIQFISVDYIPEP